MKTIAFAAAALALGVPAFGQGFNIDVGDPAFPSPGMTYMAGSTQAGAWTTWGGAGGASPHTQFLLDLTGTLSATVSMTGDYLVNTNGLGTGFSFDNANTTLDDEALLDDLWDIGNVGAVGQFIISGLADGNYDIYTYSFAPDSTTFSSNVSVVGSPDPVQLVNDGTGFGGGHGLGLTYALHSVTVAGGSDVEVQIATSTGFGSNNGIQVVPSAGDPICGDGGQSGNYCGPGGQFMGVTGTATMSGPSSVSLSGPITLTCSNLIDQPGQFVANNAQGNLPFANYMFCVDTVGLQRLVPIETPSGGTVSTVIDFANGAQTPTGTGPVNVMAGTTHYFQRWNREPGVGAGSNLSDGLAVCITP